MIKKFIINIVLLSLSTILIAGALFYLAPVDRDNYLCATIDKHNRLKNADSPRLILMGDSNLAFGVDSKKIQDALHRNVINMGIHMEYGYLFHINEVKPYIRPGDRVLIVYELPVVYNINGGGGLVELTIFYPRAFGLFGPSHIKTFAVFFPSSLQRRFSGLVDHKQSYIYRSSFDEFGSIKNQVLDSPSLMDPGAFKAIKIDIPYNAEENTETREFISHMNEFYRYCKKNRASVAMIFGPFPRIKYQEGDFSARAKRMAEQFRKNIEFPIFGEPGDYLYEFEEFYDTVYHLNLKGRAKYTEVLLKNISTVWHDDGPTGQPDR